MSNPIDRSELDFLLFDWLDATSLTTRPRYAAHERETFAAVLDLSERLATDVFLPTYKIGDQQEPQLIDGRVHVAPAIKDAVLQYVEAGLLGSPFDEALGGMQLPYCVHYASIGCFMAANVAAAGYPLLTIANARVIASFGTPAQVETFAKAEIEGRAFGTMCLSEPGAGSSLADILTLARPDGEDDLGHRYRLSGNKMWISGGDQDISDNIIHLVLAKTPGPDGKPLPGVEGISLFIVPRILPDGQLNDVAVAGLNHKMGYRGTSNCLLNFGEGAQRPGGAAGAIGWRIGEVGQGLAQMFQMMNEARTGVGLGAAALGWRGYLLARAYAAERVQGRRSPRDKTQVTIDQHPDVHRMLLAMRAYSQGALALTLYAARLMDDEMTAEGAVAEQAAARLSLLTPIVKSWPSEFGLAANDLAIQVHGGYGYTRDYDVEQLYRDNRLNPIHEGTTGVQGLDLLGRKVLRDHGAALSDLRGAVDATIEKARADEDLAASADAVADIWDKLAQTVVAIGGLAAEHRLDNATHFLRGMGHAVVAWLWLDMAALDRAAHDTGPEAARRDRIRTLRYFTEQELPVAAAWLKVALSPLP